MAQQKKRRRPKGYWQKWENLERELQEIIREIGHFPSHGELKALERRDIIHASESHHHGLPNVRMRMGFKPIRRPRGYWQKWGNLRREVLDVAVKLAHFPSMIELRTLGRHDIIQASQGHHDGLSAVRVKLGFQQIKQPNGYWKHRKNFRKKLLEITDDLGYLPSTSEMRALGHHDLVHAAHAHYGGLPAVRVRMGYEQIKRPRDYWKQWKNLKRDIQKIIEELGHFPSTEELRALERHDILNAAYTHHDGLSSVREKMGHGISPWVAATRIRSLAAIPGLADDEFVAVAQTVPGMERMSEDILLKHRTRLNLGPLELPPGTLDGGGVAFWEHCLEELQAKHPAPERLEELWVLERIAARLHRAASIEVLGREPVTAEDERRVVEFLERRAREKRAA